MSLINEASYDKQLTVGAYAVLAGISKPVLDSVIDIIIASLSQVQTIVMSADLVADDVVSGNIGGVTIAPVTYATSNAATMTALAAAIELAGTNVTAVSNGTDTITVTTALDKVAEDLTDILVTSSGAGTAVATTTETVSPISFLKGLESGLGVKVDGSTVTLATDDATHVVVGDFSAELISGSRQLDPVGEVLKPAIPVAKEGFVRIACQVKAGEVIVVGDSVAFLNGELVKKVSETNFYTVEIIEDNKCQIAFE